MDTIANQVKIQINNSKSCTSRCREHTIANIIANEVVPVCTEAQNHKVEPCFITLLYNTGLKDYWSSAHPEIKVLT